MIGPSSVWRYSTQVVLSFSSSMWPQVLCSVASSINPVGFSGVVSVDVIFIVTFKVVENAALGKCLAENQTDDEADGGGDERGDELGKRVIFVLDC